MLMFQSLNAKSNGNYPKAKKYADRALAVVISNVVFTLVICLLIIGLVSTFFDGNRTVCHYLEYRTYNRNNPWCKLIVKQY